MLSVSSLPEKYSRTGWTARSKSRSFTSQASSSRAKQTSRTPHPTVDPVQASRLSRYLMSLMPLRRGSAISPERSPGKSAPHVPGADRAYCVAVLDPCGASYDVTDLLHAREKLTAGHPHRDQLSIRSSNVGAVHRLRRGRRRGGADRPGSGRVGRYWRWTPCSPSTEAVAFTSSSAAPSTKSCTDRVGPLQTSSADAGERSASRRSTSSSPMRPTTVSREIPSLADAEQGAPVVQSLPAHLHREPANRAATWRGCRPADVRTPGRGPGSCNAGRRRTTVRPSTRSSRLP